MRKAVNHFKNSGGGVIINIASVGGLKGGVAGAVHTASKHAIVSYKEYRIYVRINRNIRCNAICQGAIKTEINLQVSSCSQLNQKGLPFAVWDLRWEPRMGEPHEVATVAVFLASDDSGFINGQCITADGGWTAY